MFERDAKLFEFVSDDRAGRLFRYQFKLCSRKNSAVGDKFFTEYYAVMCHGAKHSLLSKNV